LIRIEVVDLGAARKLWIREIEGIGTYVGGKEAIQDARNNGFQHHDAVDLDRMRAVLLYCGVSTSIEGGGEGRRTREMRRWWGETGDEETGGARLAVL